MKITPYSYPKTFKKMSKHIEGTPVALPNESKYYPAVDNLAWHRKHVFK